MTHRNIEEPLHRARVLATLVRLAEADGSVDLDKADSLWALGANGRQLALLSEQGVIHFESVGEEGFEPIEICSILPETHDDLQKSLALASEQNHLLSARLLALLRHDPDRLRSQISESELHIKDVQEQIKKDPLLQPLAKPLQDIEHHFSSIKEVAQSYDDVYKNILKPMQDESRKAIRITVLWAIIGILGSGLLANFSGLW